MNEYKQTYSPKHDILLREVFVNGQWVKVVVAKNMAWNGRRWVSKNYLKSKP